MGGMSLPVPVDVPADVPANVPAGSDLNPRQAWIVEQLRQGVEIRRVMVEREFDVGEKTAKRDLSELVQRGLIEYLRHGRNGCYRLADRLDPHCENIGSALAWRPEPIRENAGRRALRK